MRGFYTMEYTGKSGSGAGAIAFVDGRIAGVDVGGARYVGEFSVSSSGAVTGFADLSMPFGGTLVTGAQLPPGAPSIRIPFSVSTTSVEGEVLRIETPTGPVNLRLTKISSL